MYQYSLSCFFFSSRRRHTRYWRDWSSDVCSSDLKSATRLSPAIIVRDEGDKRVADFGFAGELCFGHGGHADEVAAPEAVDRESVVLGKRVDLGGRRII